MPPIITELAENIQIQSRINSFFKRFNVKECLKEARIKKLSGYSIVTVVQFLVLLVFTQKNFYAFLHSNQPKEFAKDVIYRFLNNPLYDWRRFLLKLGAGVVNNFLNPLTKPERVKALIVDDSLYSRNRSKKVELLARVFDHVTRRYVRGFRKLTVGWSDGASFVPLAFALLSSSDPEHRLYEQGPEVPTGSPGAKRRAEAVLKATEVFVNLLDEILAYTRAFQYVLFDSWFSWPEVIKAIKTRQREAICMLKDMPNIFYGYNGRFYRLSELYAVVTKRKGDILASVVVDYYGLPVRIVFVRNRANKREWLALLSTNTAISEEEIIRIYGMRWDIEVYFKMCKSFLGLAKEFQARDYDAMVAHTTLVCVRYLLLSIENRENKDDRSWGGIFYEMCEEVENISFAKAFVILLELFTQVLRDKLYLPDDVLEEILDSFMESLPEFLKRRLLTRAA
ncbi:MAG: transposase [Candidatus Aminicenantes bacterium]|nr:transposase [Candidatus Aminicenantes bacterium]